MIFPATILFITPIWFLFNEINSWKGFDSLRNVENSRLDAPQFNSSTPDVSCGIQSFYSSCSTSTLFYVSNPGKVLFVCGKHRASQRAEFSRPLQRNQRADEIETHKSNLPCPLWRAKKRWYKGVLNMEELFNSRYYLLPMYLPTYYLFCLLLILFAFLFVIIITFKQIPKKIKNSRRKL